MCFRHSKAGIQGDTGNGPCFVLCGENEKVGMVKHRLIIILPGKKVEIAIAQWLLIGGESLGKQSTEPESAIKKCYSCADWKVHYLLVTKL